MSLRRVMRNRTEQERPEAKEGQFWAKSAPYTRVSQKPLETGRVKIPPSYFSDALTEP